MKSKQVLIVATKNEGKAREFGEMLGGEWDVRTMRDLGQDVNVEEDGETFEENARKKAVEVSRVAEYLVVADDSGLEVDALNGEPGVYSARYAGEFADDASNNRKLLDRLKASGNTDNSDRGAQFRCLLVLAEKGRVLEVFEGVCRGTIESEERGEGGFGYDPLFVPEGESRTFAELGTDAKNKMSHRGRAVEKAIAYLRERIDVD